jgi:capsular polysaccharide biosynthesis protein
MNLLENLDKDFDNFIKSETDVIFKEGILIKDNKQIVNNKFEYVFNKKIEKFNNLSVDKIYDFPVFITYYEWCWNYHQNYIECMPNLIFISKLKKIYPTIKFSIPDNFFNNFYVDVFKILDINIEDCLRIEQPCLIRTCIYSTLYKKRSESCCPYTLYISNKIRDHFSGICSTPKDKSPLIYLDRLNNLAGATRYITNNNEIVTMLEKKNFKTIVLENSNLKGKFEQIMNSKIIITSIGANMANLYFNELNTVEKIILFSNIPSTVDWVSFHINALCYLTGFKKENIYVIVGEKMSDAISDPVNFSFKINLDELDGLLS